MEYFSNILSLFDFSENTNEHQEIIENTNEPQEIIENTDEPEKLIEIPTNTEHGGIVYLYYKPDKKTLKLIKSKHSSDIEKIKPVKFFFDFLFKVKSKKTKKLLGALVDYFRNFICFIEFVENLKNTDSLEYSDPDELENGEIPQNLLTQNKKRCLFTYNWTFKLNIPEKWKQTIEDNINGFHGIVKNKHFDKYKPLMYTYISCIETGILFRKKYYKQLQEKIVFNECNINFMKDMNVLFTIFSNYAKLYSEFTNRLSKNDKKNFKLYQSSLSNFPSMNMSFDFIFKMNYTK